MIKSFHAVCVGLALTVGAFAARRADRNETRDRRRVDPGGPGGAGRADDAGARRDAETDDARVCAGADEPGARSSATRAVSEGLIPVSLKIDADPAITVGAVQFAKPELRKVLDETQLVYSTPFRIAQDVTLAATPALRDRARTPGATVTIKGTLRYQACDDAICYVPVNVPVTWTVALERPAR